MPERQQDRLQAAQLPVEAGVVALVLDPPQRVAERGAVAAESGREPRQVMAEHDMGEIDRELARRRDG